MATELFFRCTSTYDLNERRGEWCRKRSPSQQSSVHTVHLTPLTITVNGKVQHTSEARYQTDLEERQVGRRVARVDQVKVERGQGQREHQRTVVAMGEVLRTPEHRFTVVAERVRDKEEVFTT